MQCEVVSIAARRSVDDRDVVVHRLEGVDAIFQAIDSGELLAALPECEIAQSAHQAALALLALARRELHAIVDDMRGGQRLSSEGPAGRT